MVNDDWGIENTSRDKLVTTENKFEFKEAVNSEKKIITIYGDKGVGKTSLALSFPGNLSVLTFDNKTQTVKSNTYNNDARIKVYNAVQYLDKDPKNLIASCMKTYEYIKFLLANIKEKDKPDYIILDGMETIEYIAEMVMRGNNNLRNFQGIANLSVWKERKLIIANIHLLCVAIANKGVIYTTHTKEQQIIQEGTLITQDKIPLWIQIVADETDIVLLVEQTYDKISGIKVFLKVITSKYDKNLKTGEVIDLTKNYDIMKKRFV